MATHKRRNMVVFGGVVDEHDRDDLRSTFYADLHVFRMDQVPPPPFPFSFARPIDQNLQISIARSTSRFCQIDQIVGST